MCESVWERVCECVCVCVCVRHRESVCVCMHAMLSGPASSCLLLLVDFLCVYYYTCRCCESCFVVCKFYFFLSVCFLFLLSLHQVMWSDGEIAYKKTHTKKPIIMIIIKYFFMPPYFPNNESCTSDSEIPVATKSGVQAPEPWWGQRVKAPEPWWGAKSEGSWSWMFFANLFTKNSPRKYSDTLLCKSQEWPLPPINWENSSTGRQICCPKVAFLTTLSSSLSCYFQFCQTSQKSTSHQSHAGFSTAVDAQQSISAHSSTRLTSGWWCVTQGAAPVSAPPPAGCCEHARCAAVLQLYHHLQQHTIHWSRYLPTKSDLFAPLSFTAFKLFGVGLQSGNQCSLLKKKKKKAFYIKSKMCQSTPARLSTGTLSSSVF